ncbi:MAG: hypothetical protein HQL32_13750, partial [Planctomycetes bacterium]|nr:hypothetical protein [Planctomycetota bacterium]
DVLNLLEGVGIFGVQVQGSQKELPLVHPARCGVLVKDGQEIGYLGECHPTAAKKMSLRKRLSFCVLFEPLGLQEEKIQSFSSLDKFPPVPFSLSLLVDEKTTAGEVLSVIQGVDTQCIRDLHWLENYSGAPIPDDKISMTVAMNFRRSDRTMNSDEIQKLQDEIIQAAAKQNFILREK